MYDADVTKLAVVEYPTNRLPIETLAEEYTPAISCDVSNKLAIDGVAGEAAVKSVIFFDIIL